MTVYGPDITEAFEAYAGQFDDLKVQERTPIVDLNAINPLSELRESWQNTSTTASEHQLSTSVGVDEIAYLQSEKRGQYTAGYESQAGVGVRIPQLPQNDEVIRWGYYTTDANEDPVDGWFFGVDSSGVFFAEANAGSVSKTYQSSWNIDTATGTGSAADNPSGFDLSLPKGNIFQIEFVYYGYGPVKGSILTDDGKVDLHKITHDGSTSVENTNLPITVQIDSGSASADAMDAFVGGRQFTIIGNETSSNRRGAHYRESLTAVDDTQWHPAVSMQLKDGVDIGSIDFTHILAEVLSFEANPDTTGYRWQIRAKATPDNPTWVTPSSHTDQPDETAVKVDVSSTNIQDGSGNTTGVFVDGGLLESGSNNKLSIDAASVNASIVDDSVVSLVFKAVPGGSGTISDIQPVWSENW